MTDSPIQDALEVAKAATPGPWEKYNANEGDGPDHGPLWAVANDAFHNPPADDDGSWFAVEIHTGHENDATFIATFDPETVTALLEAVEVLRRVERHTLSVVNEIIQEVAHFNEDPLTAVRRIQTFLEANKIPPSVVERVEALLSSKGGRGGA